MLVLLQEGIGRVGGDLTRMVLNAMHCAGSDNVQTVRVEDFTADEDTVARASEVVCSAAADVPYLGLVAGYAESGACARDMARFQRDTYEASMEGETRTFACRRRRRRVLSRRVGCHRSFASLGRTSLAANETVDPSLPFASASLSSFHSCSTRHLSHHGNLSAHGTTGKDKDHGTHVTKDDITDEERETLISGLLKDEVLGPMLTFFSQFVEDHYPRLRDS